VEAEAEEVVEEVGAALGDLEDLEEPVEMAV
jgi:hypothetical protein